MGVDPWVGTIPWRRDRLPTPVFWPGEFHGLYSPWGRKESDTTEQLSLSCQPVFRFLCTHSRGVPALGTHGLKLLGIYSQDSHKWLPVSSPSHPVYSLLPLPLHHPLVLRCL